jgi:ribulose-phosphate 3-epimerase
MKIIPTVFARTKKEFDKDFEVVSDISKDVQIDFMDGKFVKSKSPGLPSVPKITKGNYEAHLMVRSPEKMIGKLKEKGFKKVLFHYEAMADELEIQRTVDKIKEKGMGAWIVFCPDTQSMDVIWILDLIKGLDGVMFMGHLPGVEGIDLNLGVLDTIKIVKKKFKIKVEIDGGVNDKTIKLLKKAGVDIVSVGGYISKSKNPRNQLEKLKKLI